MHFDRITTIFILVVVLLVSAAGYFRYGGFGSGIIEGLDNSTSSSNSTTPSTLPAANTAAATSSTPATSSSSPASSSSPSSSSPSPANSSSSSSSSSTPATGAYGSIISPQITLSNYTTGATTNVHVRFTVASPLVEGNVIKVPVPGITSVLSTPTVTFTPPLANTASISGTGTTSLLTIILGAGATVASNTTLVFSSSSMKNPSTTQNAMTIIVTTKTSNDTSSATVIDQGTSAFPQIIDAPNPPAAADSERSTLINVGDVQTSRNRAVTALRNYNDALNRYNTVSKHTPVSSIDVDKARDELTYARRVWETLKPAHPESWFDGQTWNYGNDGYVSKCIEPKSSNSYGCQRIYKMDASGNNIKDANGNDIVLMYKCPWTCNNTTSSANACRYDSDCTKVVGWKEFLPDGTEVASAVKRNYVTEQTNFYTPYWQPGTGAQQSYSQPVDPYGGGAYAASYQSSTTSPSATNAQNNTPGSGAGAGAGSSAGSTTQPAYMNGPPSPAVPTTGVAGNSSSLPLNYYYTTNYYYSSSPTQIPAVTSTIQPYEAPFSP